MAERAIEHCSSAVMPPSSRGRVPRRPTSSITRCRSPRRPRSRSPDLSASTAAHCARVPGLRRRVVGLARDSRERQELLALGVDDVVEPGRLGGRVPRRAARARRRRGSGAPSLGAGGSRGSLPTDRGSGSVLAVIGARSAGRKRVRCLLAALAGSAGRASSSTSMHSAAVRSQAGRRSRQGSCSGSRGPWPRATARSASSERLAVREGGRPSSLARPTRSRRRRTRSPPGAGRLRPRVGASARHRRHRLPARREESGRGLPRPPRRSWRRTLLVLGARDEQLGGPHAARCAPRTRHPPQRLRVVVNGVGGPGATTTSALEHVLAGSSPSAASRSTRGSRGTGVRSPRPAHRGASRRRPPRGPYARARGGCSTSSSCRSLPRRGSGSCGLFRPAPRGEAEEEVALPWRS